MTNIDFIRKMTAEELSQCIIDDSFLNMPCLDHSESTCNQNCKQCIIEWLNKEIQEDLVDKS